jgi:hypothetical protein
MHLIRLHVKNTWDFILILSYFFTSCLLSVIIKTVNFVSFSWLKFGNYFKWVTTAFLHVLYKLLFKTVYPELLKTYLREFKKNIFLHPVGTKRNFLKVKLFFARNVYKTMPSKCLFQTSAFMSAKHI